MRSSIIADVDPINVVHGEWIARGSSSAAQGISTVLLLQGSHRNLTNRVARVLDPFDLTMARFEILTALAFSHDGGLSGLRLPHSSKSMPRASRAPSIVSS